MHALSILRSAYALLFMSSLSLLGVFAVAPTPPTQHPQRLEQRLARDHMFDSGAQGEASNNGSSSPVFHLRRGGGDRFTYFEPGMGACGKHNDRNDFIAALNVHEWDGGSHCFETITIKHGEKEAKATITDMCPSCPTGALDLSPSLFAFFAPLGTGIVYGDWRYGRPTDAKKAPAHSKAVVVDAKVTHTKKVGLAATRAFRIGTAASTTAAAGRAETTHKSSAVVPLYESELESLLAFSAASVTAVPKAVAAVHPAIHFGEPTGILGTMNKAFTGITSLIDSQHPGSKARTESHLPSLHLRPL